MKNTKYFIVIFFLLIIYIFSCTDTNKEGIQINNEQDIEAITKLLSSYQTAVNKSDEEAYANNFTEEVFWAPQNGAIANKKSEIKEAMSSGFDKIKYDLQEELIEIKSFGNHAYAILSGKVILNFKDTGDTVIYQPACIMIFQKINDDWKINRQVLNFRNYIDK
jgi:uncharacterized protein (TIGR02246 family)